MPIGNLREDMNFELECIICGRAEALTMTAFRNNKRIVGWIITCSECQPRVADSSFQLLLPKAKSPD